MSGKVYFTRKITAEQVLKLCKFLSHKLCGNVAVKVHSGEVGNQNFLRPDFWRPVLKHVGGTVCECNTAYDGQRNTTEKHLAAIKLHGWTEFPIDLLERIESRNGVRTIEAAAALGIGSREYELIDVDHRPDYDLSKKILRKTVPALAYDGSADWKERARAKLSELLGLHRFAAVDPAVKIEFTKQIKGATEIRFTFASETGYRVPCHLLLPDGAENPPVMICLQGHSKGMHISLGRPKFHGDQETMSGGDRDFCVRAIQERYAAIAMEQRHFGECGGNPGGPACYEPSMTALMIGRTAIGERVWDAMRLIDVIKSTFADKVDTDRICCMGNSAGGTVTAYLGALEDRLTLVMPSSALSTYAASIGGMQHCLCNYIPNVSLFFDMGDLIAMACPTKYVQVNGVEDHIFPMEGAREVFAHGQTAYADAGKEKDLRLVEGDGGHRFYADAAWPVVKELMK